MKKLLLAVFSVALLSMFIACQKTQDVSAKATAQKEIMTETATGAGMEAVNALECGVFRTQSQGGWGTNPTGDNPGSYLRDHFASTFPSGLYVGCNGNGYAVYYGSAAAVAEFLPAGGTAMVLTANANNPAAKSIKNVLIGQVTALAINVACDYFDPNFAPAEANLGSLTIGSGAFAGMSVNEFLTIANGVLGGCNIDYSPDAINETANLINANFLDGNINGGFLTCPTSRFER